MAHRSPNLWPFRSKAKPRKPAKRSSMTVSSAITAARKAGKESGDTGLFQGWLESTGLESRSHTLKARLRQEYEKGVLGENGRAVHFGSSTSVPKDTVYKGFQIWFDGEHWRSTVDPGTWFDEPSDAKRLIDDMRRNPKAYKALKSGARGVLSQYDKLSGTIYDYTAGLPSKLLHESLKNPGSKMLLRREGLGEWKLFVVISPEMSGPERRRYEQLAERMPEKYKMVEANPKYQPGTWIKAAFQPDKRKAVEHMWVKVTGSSLGRIVGTLDNEPIEQTSLRRGQRVTVPSRAVEAQMNTNPHGRRNPEDSASELYESFHGQPSTITLTVTEEVHVHDHLAVLGEFVNMKVATLSGLEATIGSTERDFEAVDPEEDPSNPDIIWLAAAEPDENGESRQMYLRGGDQSLDLHALKMDGDKWLRDDMIIGTILEITYRTRKKFDKFKLTDYYHELGEETDVLPMLRYDSRSELMSISGGQYVIKMPLVGVSPGIEN